MSFRSLLAHLRHGRLRHQELLRRDLRLGRRADVFLATIAASVAAVAVAGGALLGAIEQAQGFADPPSAVEPLRDERILTNIRSHKEPFVDVTVVPGEDALYAIRRSGTVHRLRLSTMLWSGEEDLRKLAPDLTTDVVLLQPGCGHQHAEASALCKSDQTLFAVTEGGGVAMRRSGRWSVLLGDTQFVGRDGRAVKADEIRSALVTSDNSLLLIGTETQGIGVFDLVRRTWSRLPSDVDTSLAAGPDAKPLAITHLIADGPRILVGTSHGLFRLARQSDGWRIAPVEGAAGRIIDLVTTRSSALVLSAESCSNAAADECIALRRIPDTAPAQLIIGEVERLPALSDTSVFHVAPSGAEIVAYGSQGVFAYIVAERRWTQRDVRPVTQIWQAATGGRLVYAHADEIVIVEPSGRTSKHVFQGVRQIVADAGPSGLPLLLTEGNQVFQVSDTAAPRQVLDDSAGRYPLAEYETAVEVADTILFLGPNGALIHDPRRRTYRTIEKAAVPAALLMPRLPLRATGNILWLLQGSNLSAFSVDSNLGNPSLSEIVPASVAAPLRSLGSGAKPETLLGVDAQGVPFEASIERRGQAATVKLTSMLGTQPTMAPGTFVDAVLDETATILATSQGGRDGIWRYDLSHRAWAGPFATELGNETLGGLVKAGPHLYALGHQGSVVVTTAGVTRSTGPPPSAKRLLGSDTLLPFESRDLTDAMAAQPLIALTGRTGAGGAVVVYDTAARRIVRSYPVPTAAPRIAGFVDALPVVYDASPTIAQRAGAWHGSDPLVADGVPAISASVRDGLILTTHRDSTGRLFIAERGPDGIACLFRQPDLLAKNVFDARELSGGLALLTDRGLRLYSPGDRRFSVETDMPNAGTRIAIFKNHLVTYDDGNARLIPLKGQGSLSPPNSCDSRPLSLASERFGGRQIAVDERQSRIALLRANGEVGLWNAAPSTVLPATTEGPDPSGLRRVLQNGDEVHFASPTAVSTYHLVSRQWRSARVATPALGATDVGLTLVGRRVAVTATDKNGQPYLGFLSTNPHIALTPIVQKEIGAAPFDPTSLIDVVELEPHLWAFLSDRELSILNIRQRQWIQRISFDQASRQRRVEDWKSHWAIRESDSRTSRIAFVPKPSLVEPTSASRALAAVAFIHDPSDNEEIALAETAGPNGTKAFELLRLLGNDELVACPLTRPGPLTACEQRLRPALQVAADTVLAAFIWSDRAAYFIDPGIPGGNRFFLADRRTRLARDLTDDLAKHGFSVDPKTVIGDLVDNDLWLRSANGRTIAISKGGASRLLLEESSAVFVAGGRLWARTQAGLRLYRDGSFLSPNATLGALFKGGDVSAVQIDRDGLAIGLRTDKTIVYEARSLTAATDPLLQAWDNWKRLSFNDPKPLQRGSMSVDGSMRPGWWIRDGNKINFVAQVPCVLPDPLGRIDSGCVRIVVSYNLPTGQWSVSEIGDQTPPTIKLMMGGLESSFRGPSEGGDLDRMSDPPTRRRLGEPAPNSVDILRRSIASNLLDRAELRGSNDRITVTYGPFSVDARGIMSGVDARPLSRPWIRWTRGSQGSQSGFQLRSLDGQPVDVVAAELFPNSIFAPTVAGWVLPASDNEIFVANPHGVWRRTLGADLVDQGPAWQRFEGPLPEIVAATNGRFYFDRGSLSPERGAVEADNGEVEVRRQALRIVETVRSRAANVAATLTIGGLPVNDFGTRGFLHDQRQSIAFNGGGAVVLTPVGVVGADSFDDIMPAPFAGSASPQLFNHDRDLYALEKPGTDVALKWTGTDWSSTQDPRQNALLYKDTNWTWSRASGQVTLDGAPWRTARGGWSFSADSVVGATYSGSEILMMSQDGTRRAARFADLAKGQAAAVPNPPGSADRVLETRFSSPRAPVAGIVESDGMGRVWAGPQGWSSLTAAVNPDRQRTAVDDNLLSIRFSRAAATIELHAEHPNAGRSRIPVSWQQRQPFPFDYAHAIGSDGSRLFIATSLALHVLENASGQWRVFDTRPAPQGPTAPLARIGRPASAPQRLLAQGPSNDCIDLTGAAPAFCTDNNPLAERTLGLTTFWSWTYRDAPAMKYLDRTGAPAGREVRALPQEGFPHDRPTAVQVCKGQAVMLWNGGAFTTELESATLGIGGRTVTDVLPVRMDRLYCQAQPANLGGPAGATLAPGLYALASNSGGLLLDAGRWVATSRDIAREATLRADDRYPFEQPRLRLRRNSPQAGLTLQYLSAANIWKALKISGRRYSIDERTKLLSADREVWTLSDDGLVRLSWAGDLLVLDLTSFHIAALPVSRGKACAVDRIEPADGSGIALATAAPRRDPKTIFLRCADGTLFSSTAIGAADDGGFAPLPSGTDPFQSRSVLATQDGAVRWKIERPVNSAGRLSVEWHGQPTPLTAGRFQADALRSVSSFQEGTLEIVSEQGWARAPERAPTLSNSVRPTGRPEAVNVRAVARDFDDRGKPFLCLSVNSPTRNASATDGGTQAAYRADGSFEPGVDCGRHDAHEGNWRYRARLQQLAPRAGAPRFSIRGFDANATAFDRPFVDGRFGDMVAVAAPILGKVGASKRILVPTTAGTTTLGDRGELIAAPVHRSPSAKLWALMPGDDDTVRVVTPSRIEFLDGHPADGCAAAPKMLEALSLRKLDDIKFLSINRTARERFELVVRAGGERLMLEQACGGEALPGQWRTIVDTAGRPRLKALGDRWPWGPEISFSWRNDRLTALRGGTAEANAITLVPNAKAPLRLLRTNSGVILATESELYRVDLDRTLSSLAQ